MSTPPEIVQPDAILQQADVQVTAEPAPAAPIPADILESVADVQVQPITPPEKIPAETVLRGAQVELPPIQREGMRLLWAIGALIAALVVEAAVVWVVNLPNLPAVPATASASQATGTPSAPTAAQVIADARTLSDAARDRSLSLIDGLVVKILLPVFTTILGYVFGTRQIEGNRNTSQ